MSRIGMSVAFASALLIGGAGVPQPTRSASKSTVSKPRSARLSAAERPV